VVAILAVAIFAGVEADYEDGDVRFDVKSVCFQDMEGAWTRSVSLHRLVKKASTLSDVGKHAGENFHDVYASFEGVTNPLKHL
jgi:hypothetical protein